MRLVFDLEADGLLNEASVIHCLVAKDLDTGTVHKFRPHEVEQGIRLLQSADLIIGHNIIQYDLAVIKKLYPWFVIDWTKVRDTIVLTRLIYTNLKELDEGRIAIREAKLIGSHSLKAWGIRLKLHKLDYEGGWEHFSEEMLEYNVGDVEVTERLWGLVERQNWSPTAIKLEHQVAIIIAEQERFGFGFDEAKAHKLTATLMARRSILEVELQETFKPFYLPKGRVKVVKKTLKRKDGIRFEGAEYQPIVLTVFNPGSRHHIANRLKFLYNWKPTEFTDNGSPKIDETVLGKLPWPEAKLLTEYFLVQKRLSMLAEGEGAWLNYLRNGRIYGQVITNGAVTGRATHRSPNVAQVPAVGALYGAECRELFTVRPGKVQVGVDVSGLELRMLAHFLARWDGGSYGRIVCDGDVHWANVQALGLTDEARDEHHYPIHKLFRDGAKTFIYGFLYGAGDEKVGTIIYDIVLRARSLNLPYADMLTTYFSGKANPGAVLLKKCGKKLKATFLEKTPGLKKLVKGVKDAAQRGYLFGLDGRKLHIRSDHAALNTLLQSGGALICKQWMVEIDAALAERGWKDRVHQMAWVHDELQFECDPEIADEFGKLAVECIGRAAAFFNIRVPLTGEYKIGSNWKECH